MTDPASPQHPARHGGGLAVWCIHHPIGVVMIALAVVVLGAFSLDRLKIDLLPDIIYPEVRVRVLDPGVPAQVMEDRITRQLEEQLAITENAIAVQSRTSEGRTAVDLSFEYGEDIDAALRDASNRLDRARRFLPNTIEPPIIYKRDPSQTPVAEFVIASPLRDPVALRAWVDYEFSRWFVNVPGVASTEVGGGLVREIQILPDQRRLAAVGLTLEDIRSALREANVETPAGRLLTAAREVSGRTAGRFTDVAAIADLPLRTDLADAAGGTLRLGEVAQVLDTHAEERLRVRVNGMPGIKLSVQKQPQANTVEVVDAVDRRLAWLAEQGLIPADVTVERVADQSVYIRHALSNATQAAASGALLAMAVVYLFLGSLRRTLIIGSVIPIAIMVTFILMAAGGLTLNIMTLGGLALGIGMLVDNTIVMLENIERHQREGSAPLLAGSRAAAEVDSAILAATSTNLAAVLPFLFISGLVGLLFRELIFTISAAIAASMVVALTVVPALATRVATRRPGGLRRWADRAMDRLARGYAWLVGHVLRMAVLVPTLFTAALIYVVPGFVTQSQIFLPDMDEGEVSISITGDPGIALEEMDAIVTRLEALVLAQPEVETAFTSVGGFVFGRSQFESSNRASIDVQLVPVGARAVSLEDWIRRMQSAVAEARLAGVEVRIRNRGVRGVRVSRGDDDISIRVQGPDLDTLARIGDEIVARLRPVAGLRNLEHSLEETQQELSVVVDRERAADLDLSVEAIGTALRVALEGQIISDFIDGDRAFDVRLRLPRADVADLPDLDNLLIYPPGADAGPVFLGDVARIALMPAPSTILRDQQRRAVEVSASLSGDAALTAVQAAVWEALAGLELPREYSLYDGGAGETLAKGQRLSRLLLGLALFLVFVVMAVQYESLRNPVIIMLSVPFATIGVALGIDLAGLPLSMPVWLGMIMLAGIVVNNAIVLVEFIEIERDRGRDARAAIIEAARLRLRPILMTTLTTVVGMLPLALGLGEGAEMLRPLAVAIVAGLAFSTVVSLVLVPCLYLLLARRQRPAAVEAAPEPL